MLTAQTLLTLLRNLEVTDMVWLPDAHTGAWEAELAEAKDIRLLRVCREGEAWALASGLYLGGRRPLLVLQNTGLFESGDALRNALFELELPLYAVVGYRNYLVRESADTAKRFTEPILRAWGIDYIVLGDESADRELAAHYAACQKENRAGVALLPEGRG